jgi:hypothetical protein
MKLGKAELERRLHNSCRDNCINWRGAAIRSGDNVVFQAKHHGSPFVGQLIDVRDHDSIPKSERDSIRTKGKNRFTRMALVRLRPFVEESDAPRPQVGDNCHLPYSMKEVSESSNVEWIPAKAMVSICFIFHMDVIQKGLVSCGGMERGFFIRFRESEGKLIPLKEQEFHPFYRDPKFPFQESYPESIWSSLSVLKQQVAKEMSCGGVWDGRTKSAKVNGVPPSFFGYLKSEFEEEAETELQYDRIRSSRPRKHMFDNFAARQIRINSLVHQI